MLFTADELARIMRCPAARAVRWHPHLVTAAGRFGILTRRRAAHWLAQVGHESLSLSRVEESLSYSRERLLEVFGNEVSPAQAGRFVHNPAALGNHVYAFQNGNGSEASGDGFLFRGRGPMQHTGRGNYRHMGKLIGLPLEEQPALLIELEAGALAAAAFWQDVGCNQLADTSDVLGVGRKINLGTLRTTRLPNGHADRVARTKLALQVLEVR